MNKYNLQIELNGSTLQLLGLNAGQVLELEELLKEKKKEPTIYRIDFHKAQIEIEDSADAAKQLNADCRKLFNN